MVERMNPVQKAIIDELRENKSCVLKNNAVFIDGPFDQYQIWPSGGGWGYYPAKNFIELINMGVLVFDGLYDQTKLRYKLNEQA